MILQTTVKDCLFLNWALPAEGLPALPAPLRYQTHDWKGTRYVFATALLFRQEQLRVAAVPLLRLSYPQFNLRICTLDEGGPSVLFTSIMVPSWVLPAARVVARQPAAPAYFNYPSFSADPSHELGNGASGGGFRWSVRQRGRLALSAVPGSRAIGPGPELGGWDDVVSYFWHRPRGYVITSSGLHEVAMTQRPADVCPLRVDLQDVGLLQRSHPVGSGEAWNEPHSAWLCPSIRFVFELVPYRRATLPRQVTAPS